MIKDHIIRKGEDNPRLKLGRRQMDVLMQADIQDELNDNQEVPEIGMLSSVGLYNMNKIENESKKIMSQENQANLKEKLGKNISEADDNKYLTSIKLKGLKDLAASINTKNLEN